MEATRMPGVACRGVASMTVPSCRVSGCLLDDYLESPSLATPVGSVEGASRLDSILH